MKKHKLLNIEEQCPICRKFTLSNSITRYNKELSEWETFPDEPLCELPDGEGWINCYYCDNCGAIFEREDE